MQDRSASMDEIAKMLIEAVMDNQLLSDQEKGIVFGVEREAFRRLPHDFAVHIDRDLLDQAINNLLDNATKYSFSNSRVQVSVGLTNAFFVISVTSKGLRIARDEIARIVRRGERGLLASSVVGEGSGIGLWIVDEIMKAHGGKLDIQATTPDGLTRVRLMFPISHRR